MHTFNPFSSSLAISLATIVIGPPTIGIRPTVALATEVATLIATSLATLSPNFVPKYVNTVLKQSYTLPVLVIV